MFKIQSVHLCGIEVIKDVISQFFKWCWKNLAIMIEDTISVIVFYPENFI